MKNSKTGFTLIEIMLAVVIIAILATIAIPSVSGVVGNAKQSVDNANAALYESALKIYITEKAQAREYVYLSELPGEQAKVANSIARIVNDGPLDFTCATNGWAYYYHPLTLQVVAMKYEGWFIDPPGMIALTLEDGQPLVGIPEETGL